MMNENYKNYDHYYVNNHALLFFDRLACVVIYLKVQIHKANKTPLNRVQQRYPFYVALMRKRLSPFNPFKVVCVSANTDRGIYI